MIRTGRTAALPILPGVGVTAWLVLLGCWLIHPTSALAQADMGKPQDGLFLSVPSPITDAEVNRIEQKVKDAVERQKRNIRTIVFDFNPGGKPASTSKPGSCIELKNFIQRLQLGRVNPAYPRMTTVAFVSDKVTRHTVLPVLACSQIVMSSKGSIGDVHPEGEILATEVKQAYQEVASHLSSPDLILKMIQRDLVVQKIRTREGVRYIDRTKVKELLAKGEVVEVEPTIPPELDAGNTVFTAQQARDLGLVKALYDNRQQVAEAFNLARQSLREDWLVGRTVVPWRVELNGTVNQGKLDSLKRRIKHAINRDANLIILHLDCEGGDTGVAGQFVQYLRELKDNAGAPIKTIAYIPPGRSLGAATYLALGCNEIVMASSAYLADFDYLKNSDPEELKIKRKSLGDLAEEQGYPRLLFEATLDNKLVLYRVESRQNPGQFRLMRKGEVELEREKKDQQQWVDRGQILKESEFLKINARLAGEWGVAAYNDVDSLETLYARYNLTQKVHDSRDDWLDRIAEFFREPIVNLFLLMIGVTALIIELKIPGIGLPGVIAGICFVLFFWAHSFVGQFTVLAVLLFLLGLVLIGIEIFVTPGFGVPGISGIILVIFSLVLVTLEKMPTTTPEWLGVGGTVATFTLGLAGAVVAAIVIGSFLPHIPYANRLMLHPPTETEVDPDNPNAGLPVHATLLGQIGVADTPLRPAGKARIGDQYVDVVSEGDYIDAGTRVQVIEIEGNRIVVKPAP